MNLFINACVRTESRTVKIAEKLLEKLGEKADKVRLSEVAFPLTSEDFLRKRDNYKEEASGRIFVKQKSCLNLLRFPNAFSYFAFRNL